MAEPVVLVSAELVQDGGGWLAVAHLGGAAYGDGTFEARGDTQAEATAAFVADWAQAYPPPDGQDPAEWVPGNFAFTTLPGTVSP